MYIWEQDSWPTFVWDNNVLAYPLAQASRVHGQLLGKMEGLGFKLREEAHLQTLTVETVKSSEIEGERLEQQQVRSSIVRRLGMDVAGLVPEDRHIDGLVEMMLDATGNYSTPVTEDRLCGWHAALFPTGYSGMNTIQVGRWRNDADGPMQVVSGPVGRRKVHYEAPPADRLPEEIARFLQWLEIPGEFDPLLVAGLTHLYFVTIHPFDDGNGRIARAITELTLARADCSAQRFYSMSAQIHKERREYYDQLEHAQKGGVDVTQWLQWFLECLSRAIASADGALAAVIRKARFWERFAQEPMNARQVKVLNRLLDDFEGKLTTSKWARLAKCSQDTAYRDILDLVERKALQKDPGGGRNTSYSICLPD